MTTSEYLSHPHPSPTYLTTTNISSKAFYNLTATKFLTWHFIEPYTKLTPNWGSLGLVVYLRTYSRYVPELGRREAWWETILRVVEYSMSLHKGSTNAAALIKEAQILYDNIFHLKVFPSGRSLWSAGSQVAQQDATSQFNCAFLVVDKLESFEHVLHLLLVGAGCGFSVEQKYVNRLPKFKTDIKVTHKLYEPKTKSQRLEETKTQCVVSFPSRQCKTTIEVGDSRAGWEKALYQFMLALTEEQSTVEIEIIYDSIRPAGERLKTMGGRACLTGDTVVYKDRKKSREENTVTIKELFDIQQESSYRFGQIKLRSLDESTGVFYRNQLLEVIDNGVCPVYEVVTKLGYKIKATANHRFMTEEKEYKHLESFNVGDLIAVNGSKLGSAFCIDCGTEVYKPSQRCKSCYHSTRIINSALDTTARQRKQNKEYRRSWCEKCGIKNVRYEVHHIDHNPHNNEHSNLLNLCCKCHQQLHAVERAYGDPYKQVYVSFDEITSINYVGNEQVYDLAMEGPNHNFVANGFVSHNSGHQGLLKMFQRITTLINETEDGKLSSVQAMDINNFIAEAVVVGGTRRSSELSLGDLEDNSFIEAKHNLWTDPSKEKYKSTRVMSNNSVAFYKQPSRKKLAELIESTKTHGDPGLINAEAALKRRKDFKGVNPCGVK